MISHKVHTIVTLENIGFVSKRPNFAAKYTLTTPLMLLRYCILLTGFVLTLSKALPLSAQTKATRPPFLSLTWADTLHKPRAYTCLAVGVTGHVTSMAALWNSWYSQYPLGGFHVFNDWSEWNQMDKLGHAVTTYQEANLLWHMGRWSGMNNKRAAWAGFIGGQIFQTTFEVFDGMSKEWGFSWHDVGFNTLGATLFTAQQIVWNEQRIRIKLSMTPPNYDNLTRFAPYRGIGEAITLKERANELYATGPVNLYMKDYNALTVWATVNPRSFMGEGDYWWPRWLNVAVGMGADNLYAGNGYDWVADKSCTGPDCTAWRVDPVLYPRTRQVFLAFDVDWSKVRTKKRWARTLLAFVNVIKFPSPTLEWNDQLRNGAGGLRMRPLYF
jgi:hypothetical protein